MFQAPSTPQEWKRVSKKFEVKWNFPNCLGAIDGKHVVIQAPHNSGSYYFNYKGQHSTVLMAAVDADYKFLITTVGCNGRISDGGVFTVSGFSQFINTEVKKLEKLPLPGRSLRVSHVFVADDAFPLQPHIMKPYPFNSQGSMRIYNYRLSRARRIVENAFGIMSSVFRVLRKPILLAPERVDSIVLAACCLHNYLLSRKSSAMIYASEGTFDGENPDTGEVIPGSWRHEDKHENMLPLAQQGSNNYSNNAREIREEFREYFVSPQGEVPWQYKLM